jgi:bacillithiol biosynthesis cysteine-adding enzyme BshC
MGVSFHCSWLCDPSDRKKRVERASQRRIAAELAPLVGELAQPGTVAVVTGQQVGLFLGPLYSVYKAAGAVAIARAIERDTGVRARPLFWLQTEDHDFEEICRCRVPGAELRISDERDRVSLAHRTLGPDVTAQLDALAEALANLPHAKEVVALLRESYQPGARLADAFAGVLERLYPELIVFDPRNPIAAKLAAPVIARSIAEHERIDQLLAARGEALRAAGRHEQIRVRPGSPLAFFHSGSPEGPRHRLIAAGDRFTLSGREESLSRAEALALVETDPMRFSTSALLRPIVQDTLLPTAVYVGGKAELDYFDQVDALYPAFDLPPTMVAERPHFRLIPPPARRLLDELHLQPADLDRPRDSLLRTLTVDAHAPAPTWAAELDHRLELLDQRAPDPTLRRAIHRTRATIHRALERLERKHHRLTVERERTGHDRLTRLTDWLRPGDAPQERVYSFAGFAARLGLDTFARKILDSVDPDDPSTKDLDA